MDGLIIFNKPVGITSAKALYRVRKIVKQRKSGHGGTLDPGATGVLVLLMGKGTKLTELIMNQPKVYRATARFDVTSESLDSDSGLLPVQVARVPDEMVVLTAARTFEGEIQQIPPKISAVKVGGKPAYKRAWQGEDIPLAAKTVQIYWLAVHAYHWPKIDFEMACGRGTYVRSLIRDWGKAMGVGGCLTSLSRTRIGPFSIDNTATFDQLESDAPEQHVIPLEEARRLLDPEAIEVPQKPDVGK